MAGNAGLSYRFQVADSDSFDTIVASGTGAVDASGIVRFTVDPALTAAKRYVWRVRAELQDAFGPWSRWVRSPPPARAARSLRRRPKPEPRSASGRSAAGSAAAAARHAGRARAILGCQRFVPARSQVRQQPVAGPRHRRVPPDRFALGLQRQADQERVVDNNGVPVTAAGDEAAYHYSGGPDQGSFDVHLVDMLVGHCGAAPSLTWRVFTGEEPGFWTGVGRF